MMLREKFKDIIEDAITYDQQYDSFEQIAEDFAIGFAQWLMKTRFKSIENIPVEKLLEIYKQEQQL